jgi:hypothetical protein
MRPGSRVGAPLASRDRVATVAFLGLSQREGFARFSNPGKRKEQRKRRSEAMLFKKRPQKGERQRAQDLGGMSWFEFESDVRLQVEIERFFFFFFFWREKNHLIRILFLQTRQIWLTLNPRAALKCQMKRKKYMPAKCSCMITIIRGKNRKTARILSRNNIAFFFFFFPFFFSTLPLKYKHFMFFYESHAMKSKK